MCALAMTRHAEGAYSALVREGSHPWVNRAGYSGKRGVNIRSFVNTKTVWIQESPPAAHKLSESE